MLIQKKPLKGVIFDMDGVLVDSHPAHLSAWAKFFEQFGITLSDAHCEYLLDGHKRSEILRHFLGDLPEQKILDYGAMKDELLRQFEAPVMTGITETLCELKAAGLKLAVATSASRERTRGMLADAGLAAHFDAITTGSEVQRGKPDPELFILSAKKLGIPPENLLVVEDAPSGAEGARAAGMQCIGISTASGAERLCAAGARTSVTSPRHLSVDALLRLFPEFSIA